MLPAQARPSTHLLQQAAQPVCTACCQDVACLKMLNICTKNSLWCLQRQQLPCKGLQHSNCFLALLQVEQLYQQASQALSIPPDRFKLVLRGSTINRAADDAEGSSRSMQRRTVKIAGAGGWLCDAAVAGSSIEFGLLGPTLSVQCLMMSTQHVACFPSLCCQGCHHGMHPALSTQQ